MDFGKIPSCITSIELQFGHVPIESSSITGCEGFSLFAAATDSRTLAILDN